LSKCTKYHIFKGYGKKKIRFLKKGSKDRNEPSPQKKIETIKDKEDDVAEEARTN
jgi:hypothetical protein